MSGSSAGSREELNTGAREIALCIMNAGNVDQEYVRKELTGLSSSTGNVFVTTSDAVYHHLENLDGASADIANEYKRFFPTGASSK